MTELPQHEGRPGVFGPRSLRTLPGVVRDLGLRRIMLVTGKQSFSASGAAEMLPELRRVADVEVWSDFSPNPQIGDIAAGLRVVGQFTPDVIVAVGGGSAMDVAKLLSAFAATAPSDLEARVRQNQVAGTGPALILVPTTSGSGSEATHFAVVYIGEDKFSVAHPTLLPDFVVLDPLLTESASPYQKATSVIDAIAQAVESLWARGATASSRAFAHTALAELVGSAEAFVGGHSSAAESSARGSHLAGRAIDVSKTTGAHAFAYGLTKRHGLSHGHAVATTLGAFARFHAAEAARGRGATDLAADLDRIAATIGAAGAGQVGDRLDAIAASLGLELRLGALGVPRGDLPVMARAVNQERLANNPVVPTESELATLVETCW